MIFKAKFLSILIFSAAVVFGQNNQIIELVTDFNTAPSSSQPTFGSLFSEFNSNTIFLTAKTQDYGEELYRYTISTGAVVRITDINSGQGSSSINHLTMAGGELLFTATSLDNVQGLYKIATDGKSLSFLRGFDSFSFPGAHQTFIEFNSLLFFAAESNQGMELWQTDGTKLGTVQVADINPGSASSNPNWLTVMGNSLYFIADNGVNGKELWGYNGSVLKRITDVNTSGDGVISELITDGSNLFFQGNDGTKGYELWKSNGNVGNADLVYDLNPNGSSYPSSLTIMGAEIFFEANNINISGRRYLWKTDGNSEPGLVKDENLDYESMVVVGSQLFFRGGTLDRDLWMSDGTESGTTEIFNFNSLGNLTEFNGDLYFKGATSFSNQELWYRDSGTGIIASLGEINPTGSSSPDDLAVAGGRLLYFANDGVHGKELWENTGTFTSSLVSDLDASTKNSSFQLDTTNETLLILSAVSSGLWSIENYGIPHELETLYEPYGFGRIGSELFFLDNDYSLNQHIFYSTQGTSISTMRVDSFSDDSSILGNVQNGPNRFCFGGYSGFFCFDGVDSLEVISSENKDYGFGMIGDDIFYNGGTGLGELYKNSALFLDLNPSGESEPNNFSACGDILYFTANQGASGNELWKTDGTTDGTSLIKDINTALGIGSNPIGLHKFNNELFFLANDGTGYDLWKSDGTTSGTVKIKDFSFDINESNIGATSSHLFIFMESDVDGWVLWKSDGTTVGTIHVMDLESVSPPEELHAHTDNKLYFSQDIGDGRGREPWYSDGTEAGTSLLIDLLPSAPSSNPDDFFSYNGDLYFEAQGPGVGRELFRLTSCPVNYIDDCSVGPCGLSGIYQAIETIQLTGDHEVNVGQSLELNAGISTTLDDGFEVHELGTLMVNVGGCN